METKTKEELKALRKKKKTLPRLVLESELYDWNPGARMTLLVVALGTRSNPEAWIQEDCPLTAEEAIGWCDMSQWRIALRVGKSESQVHRDIMVFVEDGVITLKQWADDNNVLHDMYQINIPVLLEKQRPEQKKDVVRPSRYSEKRKPNKGSFSAGHQPEKATPEDFHAEAAGD